MKKTFIILATTLLSFVFISCNNSANSTNNNSTENTQNEVWYETYYIARYLTVVKLTYENVEIRNSEGYAIKAVNGYRVVNGYAIKDIEHTTATFVSEDKSKTPYEAKFYVTADFGYKMNEMGKAEEMAIIADNWRWRINEETDHWQCSSPDWNK